MKLRAGHQGQGGLDGKAFDGGEPGRIIFKDGAFPRAPLVMAQRADQTRGVADMDADRPFQSALGDLGVRTRWGMRPASRRSP